MPKVEEKHFSGGLKRFHEVPASQNVKAQYELNGVCKCEVARDFRIRATQKSRKDK